jgi:hypothetical protein
MLNELTLARPPQSFVECEVDWHAEWRRRASVNSFNIQHSAFNISGSPLSPQ